VIGGASAKSAHLDNRMHTSGMAQPSCRKNRSLRVDIVLQDLIDIFARYPRLHALRMTSAELETHLDTYPDPAQHETDHG
jgi:hypothetical protein